MLVLCCLLTGCGMQEAKQETTEYYVVLEENLAFDTQSHVQSVAAGADATFLIEPARGYELTGVRGAAAGDVVLHPRADGKVELQVKQVKRHLNLVVDATLQEVTLICELGQEREQRITRLRIHEGINTPRLEEVDAIPGYRLIGWQTRSGESIPCGSRMKPEEDFRLKAILVPEAKGELFSYEASGDGIKITGMRACSNGDFAQVLWENQMLQLLVVPNQIQGRKVLGLASDALVGIHCDGLVLPEGLRQIQQNACKDCSFSKVFCYDRIEQASDHGFDGVEGLKTLYVEAAMAPRYSGTYYDTFPDKLGYIKTLRGQKKLVLFSGSSTRFGYDSQLLQEAFSDRKVVNMGVYAYANAYPELLLLLSAMESGDILLDAPELDATKSQFATSHLLEWQHFAMCEGDYGILAALDYRELDGVFTAFCAYQSRRLAMEARSYDLCAKGFDENGHPVKTSSYNRQGDYILYRPNATDEEPIFGLPVAYTKEALPYETFVKPYNAICRRFLEEGIRVYVTYAPRNRKAISEESTPKNRAKLQEYLESNLEATVISDVEDYLYDGEYFYETDNHLSSEGAILRTKQVIEDLNAQNE